MAVYKFRLEGSNGENYKGLARKYSSKSLRNFKTRRHKKGFFNTDHLSLSKDFVKIQDITRIVHLILSAN